MAHAPDAMMRIGSQKNLVCHLIQGVCRSHRDGQCTDAAIANMLSIYASNVPDLLLPFCCCCCEAIRPKSILFYPIANALCPTKTHCPFPYHCPSSFCRLFSDSTQRSVPLCHSYINWTELGSRLDRQNGFESIKHCAPVVGASAERSQVVGLSGERTNMMS